MNGRGWDRVSPCRLLPAARLLNHPCGVGAECCEFAITVQPDTKGKGAALRLMRWLFDWARRRERSGMVGPPLADNGKRCSATLRRFLRSRWPFGHPAPWHQFAFWPILFL